MRKIEFDLEKAKAGAKLETREGRPARIVCWDVKSEIVKILALIDYGGHETNILYYNNGKLYIDGDSGYDLFIIEETSDLQKRLEEAAIETYPIFIDEHFDSCVEYDTNECDREIFIEGGVVGIELGYKEAIEVAKEWLKTNVHGNYLYVDGGHVWVNNVQLTTDFENDMNKLLEEKK